MNCFFDTSALMKLFQVENGTEFVETVKALPFMSAEKTVQEAQRWLNTARGDIETDEAQTLL